MFWGRRKWCGFLGDEWKIDGDEEISVRNCGGHFLSDSFVVFRSVYGGSSLKMGCRSRWRWR